MGFWVEDKNADQHEHEAIAHLEDRLHHKFAAVPDSTVDDIVEAHYHELDNSPIREYVPILVENAATADLRVLAAR